LTKGGKVKKGYLTFIGGWTMVELLLAIAFFAIIILVIGWITGTLKWW